MGGADGSPARGEPCSEGRGAVLSAEERVSRRWAPWVGGEKREWLAFRRVTCGPHGLPGRRWCRQARLARISADGALPRPVQSGPACRPPGDPFLTLLALSPWPPQA